MSAKSADLDQLLSDLTDKECKEILDYIGFPYDVHLLSHTVMDKCRRPSESPPPYRELVHRDMRRGE